MPCFNFYAPAWFHVIEASRKKCSVLAEFWKKKVARKLILFEWWPTYFFSHNLFIKSVLAIGTLYSPIFCFLKVVYGIMFGVTPDIKIISFGVRRLKNRRVTPNGEEIKDEERNFLASSFWWSGPPSAWRSGPSSTWWSGSPSAWRSGPSSTWWSGP